jgi:hypothetical protein
MTNLEQMQIEAQDCFRNLWAQWYAGHSVSRPASLVVAIDDAAAAGYSPSSDLIYLPVCSGDVEEYDRFAAVPDFSEEDRWRIWKQALVHEMLHEYQYKVAPTPTSEGRALLASHRRKFDGPGHDEVFYTVITEKAVCFNLSPEELRDRL